ERAEYPGGKAGNFTAEPLSPEKLCCGSGMRRQRNGTVTETSLSSSVRASAGDFGPWWRALPISPPLSPVEHSCNLRGPADVPRKELLARRVFQLNPLQSTV